MVWYTLSGASTEYTNCEWLVDVDRRPLDPLLSVVSYIHIAGDDAQTHHTAEIFKLLNKRLVRLEGGHIGMYLQ